MKIAALQMVSSTRVDDNLATARRLIEQAARDGAELVVLPEYFCLMGRSDRDKLTIAEAPGGGPIQRMLADAARANGVWVIGGTLPLRCEDRGADADADGVGVGVDVGSPAKVLNSNGVWAPDGRLAARYDKLHLFRYDNGRERYDEGHTIQSGKRPVAFDLTAPAARPVVEPSAGPGAAPPLRVGLSICYDLRFPELYRALMRPPCDLLSVPSAFTHTTGLAHWTLLLRARAVENQCYVIAAAQGGVHENGRRTFGHSMVVDPWGEVLAVQAEGEGVVMADLDPARISAVRRQLPALDHRRDDLRR